MHWCAIIVLFLCTSLPLAPCHMTLCFCSARRAFSKRVYRAQLACCAPAMETSVAITIHFGSIHKICMCWYSQIICQCEPEHATWINPSHYEYSMCTICTMQHITLLRPEISISASHKNILQSITMHPKIGSRNNQKRGQNRLPGVTAHLNQITRMRNEHVTLGFFHLHKTITPWTVGSMSSRLHASSGVISRRHTRLAIN